ncbi:MAG: CHASE2 domain-containing protein [Chthoniobacterales bacterium]|nr:CHASE2 domain-containing protein [Chthoniobacterales bacterium]
MRPLSLWPVVVIILLGVLIAREPRLQRVDDVLLYWFMANAVSELQPAAVTLVEVGRDDSPTTSERKPAPKGAAAQRSFSPLELALFLQAALDFQPAVIGFEPILIWRERDKDQEQLFTDQAMRVPKLLVAMELGGKGPRDLKVDDIPTLPQVTGERGHLAEFTGVSHRPGDDIRLISTPGFINLPNDRSDRIRVPMLLEYRGEIVPSFPLQAIMLWLRATPADIRIELGSHILLPNGWRIPLHRDGTTKVNPAAARSVRRLTLNQLLLAAQERSSHSPPTMDLTSLKGQIILLRLADDPLQPPNIFSTAIATVQSNAYLRAVPWFYDWLIILLAAAAAPWLERISKSTSLLVALALSAGYGLLALSLLESNRIWLPTFLPLALLWTLILVRLFVSPAPLASRQ